MSVYCGDSGWVDPDPTNDVFPSTDHITVASEAIYQDEFVKKFGYKAVDIPVADTPDDVHMQNSF